MSLMPLACAQHGREWEDDCQDCATTRIALWASKMVEKDCPRCGAECKIEVPSGDDDIVLRPEMVRVACVTAGCGYRRHYGDDVA